jgi:hypothetical protein
MPTKKHLHYDVLIAIAEGGEVEFREPSSEDWLSARDWRCGRDPLYRDDWEWRVKPVPVIRYEWLLKRLNEPAYAVWDEEVTHWDIKITYEDDKPIKVEAK